MPKVGFRTYLFVMISYWYFNDFSTFIICVLVNLRIGFISTRFQPNYEDLIKIYFILDNRASYWITVHVHFYLMSYVLDHEQE